MKQGAEQELLGVCALLVFLSILHISFFALIAFLAFLVLLPVLTPLVVIASLVYRFWPSPEPVPSNHQFRTALSGIRFFKLTPKTLEEIYDEYFRRGEGRGGQSRSRLPVPNVMYTKLTICPQCQEWEMMTQTRGNGSSRWRHPR